MSYQIKKWLTNQERSEIGVHFHSELEDFTTPKPSVYVWKIIMAGFRSLAYCRRYETKMNLLNNQKFIDKFFVEIDNMFCDNKFRIIIMESDLKTLVKRKVILKRIRKLFGLRSNFGFKRKWQKFYRWISFTFQLNMRKHFTSVKLFIFYRHNWIFR